MIDNWSALDRIEHVERETPFCSCGQPTSAVARPDGIWLECISLRVPNAGLFGRLLSTLAVDGHIRQLIVELDAEAA
jgi:hypothetical protein